AARGASVRDRRRVRRRRDFHAARCDFSALARRAAVAVVRARRAAGALRFNPDGKDRSLGSDELTKRYEGAFGRLPTVTSTSAGFPSRHILTLAVDPGVSSAIRASNCGTSFVGLPAISTTTSRGSKPAR